MSDLDYAAESHRLDDLERATLDHNATARKVAVATARYQLDQAVSLAILADGIETLVAHIVGAVPEQEQPDADAAPEQVWTLATEAEVGDLVVARSPETGGPMEGEPYYYVEAMGTSEGDLWITLKGLDKRHWAKGFVIVEGAEDADEELADRIEADDDFIPGGTDNLGDDFAEPAKPKLDGLGALKAGKGKGKK